MANVHTKKAGQWAKEQSIGIRNRWLSCIAALVMAQGIVIGFCAARFSPPIAIVLLLTGFSLLLLISRPLVRTLNEANVTRLRYLRGGQAEGLVAWYLRDLPEDWHVFHNLRRPGSGDIDHVVVGPGGLFVISTKAYKGHVVRRVDGTVTINGHRLTALSEAMGLGMWLQEYLKPALGPKMPWMQAVLALPLAAVNMPAKEGKVWIVDEDAILGALNPEKLPRDRRLSTAQIAAVVAGLERLTEQQRKIRSSPS